MKTKIISFMLALCLVLSIMTISVFAADEYTYEISATTTTPAVGEEFDVTISLTNYAEAEVGLMGIQIDISNIDNEVFEIVSYSSLVNDSNAVASKPNDAQLRLFYINIMPNGILSKDTTGLITFKLKVKDTITQSGSVSMPIQILMTPTGVDGGELTFNEDLTINYVADTQEPSDTEVPRTEDGDVKAIYVVDDIVNVYSVDVTWGAMEFDYYPGGEVWNVDLHLWESDPNAPAKWTVNNDSNKVTLANHSSTEVNASLAFVAANGYTELSGSFTYDGAALTAPLALELPAEDTPAKEYVVTFMPEGKIPSSHSDATYAKMGAITLTLV